MTDLATPTHADWIERARALDPATRPFIDGDYVSPLDGRPAPDTTPRDGSVIAEVETAGARDVDRAVAAARRAFEDGRWADRSPVARKRILLRFAELVREHTDELALLESLDVGHPISDATRVDVPGAANCAITRRVTAGESSASPAATVRTAAISCSGGSSLSTKPLAPACSAS